MLCGLHGWVETIRLMLRTMGVEFDDHRVVSSEPWPELKPQLPFGKLPLYEAAGVYLPESHAISWHLTRSSTSMRSTRSFQKR